MRRGEEPFWRGVRGRRGFNWLLLSFQSQVAMVTCW